MIRFLFLPPVFIKTQRSRHSTFEHITKIFNFIKHTPNKTWLLQSSPPPPQSSPTPPPSSASHPPSSASTRSSAPYRPQPAPLPQPPRRRSAAPSRQPDANLRRAERGLRPADADRLVLRAPRDFGPAQHFGRGCGGCIWVGYALAERGGGVESLAYCAGGGGLGGGEG